MLRKLDSGLKIKFSQFPSFFHCFHMRKAINAVARRGRTKATRPASNPPTDPRIHFCRHALRERSIASAAGGGGKRGRMDGRKDRREEEKGREPDAGSREGGCVEDERLGLPTLEQPNIKITAPTVTERAGGRWSEPFLKAAVADHRSFPDGSRIALLSPSYFRLHH